MGLQDLTPLDFRLPTQRNKIERALATVNPTHRKAMGARPLDALRPEDRPVERSLVELQDLRAQRIKIFASFDNTMAAIFGIAIKLVRRAMVDYRSGVQHPTAERRICAKNQVKMYGMPVAAFVAKVQACANDFLKFGCEAKIIYSDGEVRLVINVIREPHIIPPPEPKYQLVMSV